MISEATNKRIVDDLLFMIKTLEPNLRGFVGNSLLNKYKQTLRVSNPSGSWVNFMKRAEGRDGYSMEQRFNGWASSSPFPAVPFVRVDTDDRIDHSNILVVLTEVKNNTVMVASIGQGNRVKVSQVPFHRLIPLFVNKLGGSSKLGGDLAGRCARIRDAYKDSGYDFTVRSKETRDDLRITNPYPDDNLLVIADDSTLLATTISNATITQENTTMKNTKADNFIQDQKAIATQIAQLNAGRVSNKVVKEAMRPLVALLFKPTWAQKLAMKLTGARNPLDEFMNTPYADLLCAQLFKVAIDIREVDNKHVKDTANSAVVYAGLKVTEQLPIEELIDKAIAQVTEVVPTLGGTKGE